MRLRDAFNTQRWRLRLGFGLFFLTILAGIALLAISGWFITAAAITGMATAAGILALLDVFTPGTAIRFFALLRTVSRYFERVLHHDAVLRIQALWRGQLFQQLTALPSQQFGRLRAGTIVQRLTQDLSTLDSWYLRLIAPQAVAAVALFAVWLLIAVFSFTSALWLVILSAAVLALLWVLAVPVAKCISDDKGRVEVQLNNNLRQHSMDFYEGAAELYASRQWQAHGQLLAAQGNRLNQQQRQRLQQLVWIEMAVQGGIQILALVVLLAGLNAYLAGAIALPIAVMQALAVLALAEIMQPLAEQSGQVGLVAEARDRIQRLPEELRTAASEPPIPSPIAITPMHVHGVIGASGSGKSTLAGYAAAVLGPPEKALAFADAEFATYAASLPRQQCGYLPQSNFTLAGTIADNLRIAAPNASSETLWQALCFAQLEQEVRAMPEGLQTWLGTGGVAISGGQARRLMLARIYLQNPPWVVLDEPTTGLDEATAKAVIDNLSVWLEGRTALVCGHSAESLPHCHHYTVINASFVDEH